jgi:hypothetical protein
MWVTPVKLSVDDSTRTVTAICNARDGQVIEWRERFGER